MQDAQPNLFTRDDTFFGICQGIGEDLGINPFWLRLPFIPLLFFWPVETVAGYAAAGVIVLATRVIFPTPRPASAEPINVEVGAEVEAETVPLAA